MVDAAGARPQAGAEARRILDTASDIALEQERQLCRLAEVVYFSLEMQYQRIGIAFCIDLLEPAEILAGVLERFFEVIPVCCKVGGVKQGGSAAEYPEDFPGGPSHDIMCNPLGQASILNRSVTDLNIIVGLCVGADCLFTQASHAPVTTLFVKDRSLANNPIGAVYSEYYLRESLTPASGKDMRDAVERHGLGMMVDSRLRPARIGGREEVS